MAEPTDTAAEQRDASPQLESGAYEIICGRLATHGEELRKRLDHLNEARRQVFGAIDTKLLGATRITTANNCVPRDIVSIGDKMLFGYNVHIGLRSETSPQDVFALYAFRDHEFHEEPLDLLEDERFQRDFAEVYRYYKDAVFAKFFARGEHLYLVFRVGKSAGDIKAFKWRVHDDRLEYVDSRSDHEIRYPPQHEFQWQRTTRDQHLYGAHPHVSIEDRVFVETIGGDLTIKVEDNTDSGKGIYAEPVDNVDQTLDDAEVHYAIVGNLILLKIRPYQEEAYRYLVFNEKVQTVKRFDSIAQSCILLPGDQGIIFPHGYYLQTGEYKTFDNQLSDLLFEKRVAASNGEDILFQFYNRLGGSYVLLQYNQIEQEVQPPLICNGATHFSGGELVCFKAHEEPQKHHALQVWQTPYVDDYHAARADNGSLLFKVGNRDLVRGMAECREIIGLIGRDDAYADLYVDIVKKTSGLLDSYYWLKEEETFHLDSPLAGIRDTAAAAIEEFEKVVRIRRSTAEQTDKTSGQLGELLEETKRRRFEHIDDFVHSLSELRRVRGDVISLRELRYSDADAIDTMEQTVQDQADQVAGRCVDFLLRPDALTPYRERIEQQRDRVDSLAKVTEAKELEGEIDTAAADLEMLIDVVSNLKIDDATQRTAIIDSISVNFSTVNQARAALKNKSKALMSVEGSAEFNSQLKLLNQSVVNYLDVCDSPAKCDELITKLMVQIEELEGRFAEFDDFVLQLTDKREEISTAFEQRKLALVEARSKRTSTLATAADRILGGISTRIAGLEEVSEINGYFATDLMVDKVRDIVEQLLELEDTVKVDEIQSRLKSIREDAVRQLKDRKELFVGGENVIKLGRSSFTVNTQPLDLTTVTRDEQMCLHVTGTNFFEPLEDRVLLANRDLWSQQLVSEDSDVYRAEYLAHVMLQEILANRTELGMKDVLKLNEDQLNDWTQKFMSSRYDEGYVKGVHDHDAAKLLRALAEMHSSLGLLRFSPAARALASVFWRDFGDADWKARTNAKLKGFGSVGRVFPDTQTSEEYVAELGSALTVFTDETGLFNTTLACPAGAYLFEELAERDHFVISRRAADLHAAFLGNLKRSGKEKLFSKSVERVQGDAHSRFCLARDWSEAFLSEREGSRESRPDDRDYVDELAVLLSAESINTARIVEGSSGTDLDGLLGSHAAIQEGSYHLNYNRFMERLVRYQEETVTRYREFIRRKKEVVDAARAEVRLEEFRPRVLTSFVRNKLIDEVYLPLIGDNLAKQIGVVGEEKRTDLMGLLLLVSPPGYGKTTLMEYVANRLGVIFMKINGPALGHRVTSLDPSEATNAAAREEVEKLNLALEMGDNVMIYLDDIQHCNTELLQKFISLCDAQRKIEGVYRGRSRTYDLRGRKVVVVMAGNPYTESGERFQIPDMLANRADVYNLGEIIGDTADAFEMSYLENSLTSNPVLNKLTSRSHKDVYSLIRLAETDDADGVEFEGAYSPDELREMVEVMRKLILTRDVILKVNREYIRSAAMADEYRTEPPFKLQGSYRNMNRMAEKISPLMNEAELNALILSNYENDSQTLTSDNESNMLKFKELMGLLSDEEEQRWEHIKSAFARNARLHGVDSDNPLGQAVVQLSAFSEGLESIRRTLQTGVESGERTSAAADAERESLAAQIAALVTAFQSSIDQSEAQREVDSSAGGTAEAMPPRKVIVQHKVPKVVLDVVQSQFDLMQQWLSTILAAENLQVEQTQQLRESLDRCLGDYVRFKEELEEARDKKR